MLHTPISFTRHRQPQSSESANQRHCSSHLVFTITPGVCEDVEPVVCMLHVVLHQGATLLHQQGVTWQVTWSQYVHLILEIMRGVLEVPIYRKPYWYLRGGVRVAMDSHIISISSHSNIQTAAASNNKRECVITFTMVMVAKYTSCLSRCLSSPWCK